MKADELRELSSDDLETRLEESREEFFNLRFQNATGQLENFAQIGTVKREIARIRTIVRERELGLEVEVRETTKSRSRASKSKEEDEKRPRRSRKKVEESDD